MSRLVDRPLRPMFTAGWANETQVLEWVVSYDGVNAPEPIAITAAAAALLISGVAPQGGMRKGVAPQGGMRGKQGWDSFVVRGGTEHMGHMHGFILVIQISYT